MVDLANLAPALLGQQLAKPEGMMGRVVAAGMNKRNGPIYEAALQRLSLPPHSHLLEIGFGNGKLVPRLFDALSPATYAGIDISATMVEEAQAFNADLIRKGQAEFKQASVEAIPYRDHVFDGALAINVIYFWPDPVKALREIRRVLKPDGVLFVSAGNPEMMAKNAFTQHGFRLYTAAQLGALHQEAGFQKITIENYDDQAPTLTGSGTTQRQSIFMMSRA
jgi:ubiquinone/menaquinone biosynthesis C-methylase UbiE